MRNTLPQMTFVQETLVSLAGHVRVGVEASNGSITGDEQFHANSGNTLAVPPLDPYGPATRYFDVFSTGPNTCKWEAAPWESWVKLSQTHGTVGPKGEDTRVFISVDWDNAPTGPNSTLVNINITTPCREFERHSYNEPMVQVPVVTRSVPGNFTEGFVESDGHVAIEGPHYQSVGKPKSSKVKGVKYHTFKNYGRTLGGVGILPLDTEKLTVDTGPSLKYDMYLFSNYTTANVTLYLSPSHNYLSEFNPLEYAIALYPVGGTAEPKTVRFVGPTDGANMPVGWGYAVGDAVWGVSTNTTTTGLKVGAEGAYTLEVWCLLPSIIVQKVVVNLGGVRPSYLGPPESFLVGRDELGEYDQLSFASAPGTLGGA